MKNAVRTRAMAFFRVFLFLNSLLSRLLFVIVRMADLSFSWKRISICRIYWKEGGKEGREKCQTTLEKTKREMNKISVVGIKDARTWNTIFPPILPD